MPKTQIAINSRAVMLGARASFFKRGIIVLSVTGLLGIVGWALARGIVPVPRTSAAQSTGPASPASVVPADSTTRSPTKALSGRPKGAPTSEPAGRPGGHEVASADMSSEHPTGPHDAEPPLLVHPIPIEDPGGDALRAFHKQLLDLERGRRKEPVRLTFFGASHVASDLFTNVVRSRLQARFGDSGPGFILPGKPRRHHHHTRVAYQLTRGFKGIQVRVNRPGIDVYGLAGVALDAPRKRRGHTLLTTRSSGPGIVDQITLYYLRQPHGGRFQVRVDGKLRQVIATRARKAEPGYHSLGVPPGHHELELRTLADGPVRLFGVAMEKAGPGVVVDTLGVPGSRARYQLQWESSVFREHLQRRDPALVVLAYGTNESGDDDVPLKVYEKQVRSVLRRVQGIVPNASCLLIGPSDRPIREADSPVQDRTRTSELIKVQRKVASAMGCGFFDLVQLMGGPLSMMRWAAADPALGAPDHIHYTRLGYQRVGEVLYDALMANYPPHRP